MECGTDNMEHQVVMSDMAQPGVYDPNSNGAWGYILETSLETLEQSGLRVGSRTFSQLVRDVRCGVCSE